MKTSMVVGIVVTAVLIAFSGVAFAGPPPTPCSGFLAAGTYTAIVVLTGNSCRIGDDGAGPTLIAGDVTVQAGADLIIGGSSGDVVIHGSVKGLSGCDFVEVDHSGPSTTILIGGNLDIESCGDGNFNGCRALSVGTLPAGNTLIGGNMTCVKSTNGSQCVTDRCIIAGDLTCSGNSGGCVVPATTIGGNATLNNNSGGTSITASVVAGNVTVQNNSGGAAVTGNAISGNLTCANTGGTIQSGNEVAGKSSCF